MPYIPIEEYQNKDFDRSSFPIRDFPVGKHKYHITPSTLEVDFGNITNAATSYNKTVLLTNSGYDDLTIDNIIIVGPFVIESVIPTKILVGQTVSVKITFTPTAVAAFTGGIYVDSDEIVGDQFIKLIGSGI